MNEIDLRNKSDTEHEQWNEQVLISKRELQRLYRTIHEYELRIENLERDQRDLLFQLSQKIISVE